MSNVWVVAIVNHEILRNQERQVPSSLTERLTDSSSSATDRHF
jgi:hypothetical protein